MDIGKVVGNVWATRKDEKLCGQNFSCKILKTKGTYKEGFMVAADNAGAGNGDLVLISRGSSARESIEKAHVPVDATIVGVVDSFEVFDE